MSMFTGKLKRSCKRLSIVCGGGRTQQHFAAQCDVNSIVEKARVSGLVSHVNAKSPVYMDVSSVPDYQSALAIVDAAQATFKDLSSKVRERFANDPVQMIDFMNDKANYDECVRLGLFVPKPVVDPVVDPITAKITK